jgi:hypothetical protein
MLGNYGLALMMEYGVIDIYSGAQPELAQFAPTGTRLGRVTKGGGVWFPNEQANGLTLDQGTPGALMDTGDWVLTGIANGTAGWWRWKWNLSDTDAADPYYPRVDGMVGESLVLADTAITVVTSFPIDRFYLTFEG